MAQKKEPMKTTDTEWIDVNTIAKEIIPASKPFIRKFLREHCDCLEVGNRLVVEKSQLLAALRKEI